MMTRGQVAVATVAVGAVVLAGTILGSQRGPLQSPSGHVYYVSPAGSDGGSGTALQTPWRTVGKCAAVAVAGDSCLIRTGTYHETLAPAHSGTALARITFRPYQDEQVTLDGADEVQGWTAAGGGGVYTASVTLPISGTPPLTDSVANQVFLDDRMLREAQWPSAPVTHTNPLSLTFSSAGAGTTYPLTGTANVSARIVDAALPITSTNMVGAIVHYWGGDSWWSNTGVVTGQGVYGVAGTPAITYTQPYEVWDSYYIGSQPATRYYLLGTRPLLDAPAEWAYLPVTQTLVLRTPDGDSPAAHLVRARQRPWAVDLAGRSYITVRGLLLQAGGVRTTETSAHNTLDDLDVRYPTHMTMIPTDNAWNPAETRSGVVLAGQDDALTNSQIAYSAGASVSIAGVGERVVNNLIHDGDYDGALAGGISLQGRDAVIRQNTIYNTAGASIDTDLSGPPINQSTGASRIAYNDLFTYNLYQLDQGGLYQCCDTDLTREEVDHNWVHDCRARFPAGMTTPGAYLGNGLYFDNGSHGYAVHHNVLWQTCILGIGTNASRLEPVVSGVTVANNTFADGTTSGGYISGDPPVLATASSTGMRYRNNLYLTAQQLPTYLIGASVAGDVRANAVRDVGTHDFRLRVGSSAVDAGTVVPGITDGYLGTAPDAGAYEYGAAPWRAGCTRPACRAADPAVPAFIYGAAPASASAPKSRRGRP